MRIVNRGRDPGRLAEDILEAAGWECWNTGCLGSMWRKDGRKAAVYWYDPIEGHADGRTFLLDEPGGLRMFRKAAEEEENL